ncbi:MAG: hypothetical protein R3C28_27745 [Pirellulaceae bacterium]
MQDEEVNQSGPHDENMQSIAFANQLRSIPIDATPNNRDELMYRCGFAASGGLGTKLRTNHNRRALLTWANIAIVIAAFFAGSFAGRIAPADPLIVESQPQDVSVGSNDSLASKLVDVPKAPTPQQGFGFSSHETSLFVAARGTKLDAFLRGDHLTSPPDISELDKRETPEPSNPIRARSVRRLLDDLKI